MSCLFLIVGQCDNDEKLLLIVYVLCGVMGLLVIVNLVVVILVIVEKCRCGAFCIYNLNANCYRTRIGLRILLRRHYIVLIFMNQLYNPPVELIQRLKLNHSICVEKE